MIICFRYRDGGLGVMDSPTMVTPTSSLHAMPNVSTSSSDILNTLGMKLNPSNGNVDTHVLSPDPHTSERTSPPSTSVSLPRIKSEDHGSPLSMETSS